MFEDIIGEDKVIVDKKPKYTVDVSGVGLDNSKSDPPACKNCVHGSHILSNYPGKVLCQKYRRHKDLNYKCNNWELRK